MKTELVDRLAGLRLEVDPATADRQISTIAAALREPVPNPTPARRWRIRLAPILAGLAVFIAPATGVAIAAEGSIPGDALYPVKQLTEQVRSWFDPGVVVDHRLDELEAVLDRGVSVEDVEARLAAADEAVASVADHDERLAEFDARLDAARQRVRTEYRDEPSRVDSTQDRVDDSSTELEPSPERDVRTPAPAEEDRSEDRTRTRATEEPNRDGTATTTTSTTTTSTTIPPRDGGQPPGDGDGDGDGGGGGGRDGSGGEEPPPRRGDG